MSHTKYTTPIYFCVDCSKVKDPEDFYPYNKRHCKHCISRKHKKKYSSNPAVAQARLQRVLQMWVYLSKERRTVEEMARNFDMTTRTIYRYLRLLDSLDLGLEQAFDNKYFVVIHPCPLCGSTHTTNNHYK